MGYAIDVDRRVEVRLARAELRYLLSKVDDIDLLKTVDDDYLLRKGRGPLLRERLVDALDELTDAGY